MIDMLDKIKINLPERVVDTLKKDAEDFRIFKAGGGVNLNALVNLLVVNFYEEFSSDEEALHDGIRRALAALPESYRRDAFDGVIRALRGREKNEEELGKTVPLSFKPTRSSERAVIHIENVLLSTESLSSFYRRMMIAYSKRAKPDREKIIFKDNYRELHHAIRRGTQVCISIEGGDVYRAASVYAVEEGRDEYFNYVLFYSDGKNRTVRLSKVRTVSHLTSRSGIPEPNRELFERQIECGAQYPMHFSDNEPILVRLTERGKMLFNKIYLYRPTPASVDGDVYTFNCSANQLLYFFERFGSDALILSPKKLGVFMRNYHYFALKKYRTLYGRE